MKQVILVFLGGGLGSSFRYLIGKYLNNCNLNIPFGTLTVNLTGSLIIGILLGLATKNNLFSQNLTLLLATGFCGGFTTFSTFAYENQLFLRSGDYTSFALYTLTTLVVGVLAVFLGIFIVK